VASKVLAVAGGVRAVVASRVLAVAGGVEAVVASKVQAVATEVKTQTAEGMVIRRTNGLELVVQANTARANLYARILIMTKKQLAATPQPTFESVTGRRAR